ncbi:hypothetical protein INR49_027854 [Caranx melampygus]|nr:hypothetical protein INR49_027854 [Caranx melampygus]
MNISGIHRGALRLYGGFIFKQWKKRFLLLTAEGTLLVCHDASSPPDQLVLLQSSCEAIVEGKEILDLPKLPSGGSRTHKYLLLLADTPADCRSDSHCALSLSVNDILQRDMSHQWLNLLKKVKKSLSSPLSPCKRHQVPPPPHITLHDLVPEQIPDKIPDKDPGTSPASDREAPSPGPMTCPSPRETGRNSPRTRNYKGSVRSSGCLRHGSINNAQAVRAVYLLMGGAAASSAMGYLGRAHLLIWKPKLLTSHSTLISLAWDRPERTTPAAQQWTPLISTALTLKLQTLILIPLIVVVLLSDHVLLLLRIWTVLIMLRNIT